MIESDVHEYQRPALSPKTGAYAARRAGRIANPGHTARSIKFNRLARPSHTRTNRQPIDAMHHVTFYLPTSGLPSRSPRGLGGLCVKTHAHSKHRPAFSFQPRPFSSFCFQPPASSSFHYIHTRTNRQRTTDNRFTPTHPYHPPVQIGKPTG